MRGVSAVGIDLGTTYSVVAAVDASGTPQVLRNREGDYLTPSVVFFDGEAPMVGAAAAAAGALRPHDYIELVKRSIGDADWRCVTAQGTSYGAEEISAMLLRRLVDDAAQQLGRSCSEVVITVPAYFDDARRRATADAGIIAGLDVLRIVNEPTAAALAYGFGEAVGGNRTPVTLLVYDWGGGTFDVTLVRIAGNDYTVLATAGDRNLGGFDIDNALMCYVDERVLDQGGCSSLDSDVAELMLRERCEAAKRELSSAPETTVTVDYATSPHHERAPNHEQAQRRVPISRPVFAELTAPLLRRTEEIVAEVLTDARLGSGELSAVLLVGGSTRMPMVSRMLRRVTGAPVRGDTHSAVHPDHAVALGAAILADHAAALRRGEALPKNAQPENYSRPLSIHDVTAHSLGLVARSAATGAEINSIVIERNTPLPAQGRQRFHTLAENQREILVVVTQGEDVDPSYVTVVGSARIDVPASKDSVEVEVVIGYDEQGLIGVQVTDADNGVALGEFSIDRQANVDAAELTRMRRSLQTLEIE